jgi:hypothetical protein
VGLAFNKVQNILVLSAGSLRGIRFSITLKAINHLIHSSGQPSLKLTNYLEYLDDGLAGSMRYYSLISSILSISPPSALSNFLTLKRKGIGGFNLTAGGSPTEDLVVLTMMKFRIDSQLSVYADLHKVKL